MKIDIYSSALSNSVNKEVGLTEFYEICESPLVTNLVDAYRNGDKDAKKHLPAATYMGKSTTGKRNAADMTPTGLVMIDIDHADEHLSALRLACLERSFLNEVRPALIHITPSGKGMRIVYPMSEADTSIEASQLRVVTRFHLDAFGDFDKACKDLSRLSFLPKAKDIVFVDGDLLFGDYDPPKKEEEPQVTPTSSTSHADFEYNGVPVAKIAAEYVEWKGEPQEGETHNFYNAMVADFRHICNNSPAILVDVLPLFGQTRENRLSQCTSICKRNTSLKIPPVFWGWLCDKGYYIKNKAANEEEIPEDPYQAEHELLERMPQLPPVFRQYINSAPTEFKIPVLFALLPIMGSLATYLQAQFYDGEMHTTSFFTIIYAPAGQGKSFINRLIGTDVWRIKEGNLISDFLRRDAITEARTNLWLRFSNNKKDSERGKDRPKVTTRVLPAIFSQADFLPVMKDNQGMHMFCFAPEIDTLIKGMKAGGGDKNDIFRVAWDNGTYGQSYRGINSFRGKVALFLNVLSTGTPAQCNKLFANVENGLVTRCSFTDLGNQDFAAYQPWKKMSKKDIAVIETFKARCDAATYTAPLTFKMEDLDTYENDEEMFDSEVPWQFSFRGRQTINLDYINKELLKWLEKQRKIAQMNADFAHDAFRKRTAVRAFRLALLCYSCWSKVGEKERKVILDFILWYADLDLMKALKKWGDDYNKLQSQATSSVGQSAFSTIFETLDKEFSVGDVVVAATKAHTQTAPRKIIHVWKKANLIEKIDYKKYRKL